MPADENVHLPVTPFLFVVIQESMNNCHQYFLLAIVILKMRWRPSSGRNLQASGSAPTSVRLGTHAGSTALLLIRLRENWRLYREFDAQTEVPWTNNGIELEVGKMKAFTSRPKTLSRALRSYRTNQGILAELLLSGIAVTCLTMDSGRENFNRLIFIMHQQFLLQTP